MRELAVLATVLGAIAAALPLAAQQCALDIPPQPISTWDEYDEKVKSPAEKHPGFEVCGDCRELFLLRLDGQGRELAAFKSVRRRIGREVWGGKKSEREKCQRFKVKPANLNSYCIDSGLYTGAYDDSFERLPFHGRASDLGATAFRIKREDGYRKRDWGCPDSPVKHAVEVSGPKPQSPSCKGVLLGAGSAKAVARGDRRAVVLAPSYCLRDIEADCGDELTSCLRIRLPSEVRLGPEDIVVTEIKEHPHGPKLSLLQLNVAAAAGLEGIRVAADRSLGDRFLWSRSGGSEVMFPLSEDPRPIHQAEGDLVLDEDGFLIGLVVRKKVREYCPNGCRR